MPLLDKDDLRGAGHLPRSLFLFGEVPMPIQSWVLCFLVACAVIAVGLAGVWALAAGAAILTAP